MPPTTSPHNCQVQAWISRCDKPLLQSASGPLAGLRFAVKDNMDVAGLPTTAACPAFSHTAATHAVVVHKLLDAGASLLGKTNLDQFACGLNGTRSPAQSVDCASIFARTVAVAASVLQASMGYDPLDPYSRKLSLATQAWAGNFRFGVPSALEFFGDTAAQAAFAQAVQRLVAMGGTPVSIDSNRRA